MKTLNMTSLCACADNAGFLCTPFPLQNWNVSNRKNPPLPVREEKFSLQKIRMTAECDLGRMRQEVVKNVFS